MFQISDVAPITIVDSLNPEALAEDTDFTTALAERFEESPRSNFLVLTFERPEKIEPDVEVKLLKPFAHPERVEISEDIRTVPRLVESLAVEIARVFGLSLNALAQILGRSRQALTKTPDADSLQDELSYFERIARLRTVLSDDSEFRKWLRMPHADLNGETPLRWIERKRWQALADLVDDMLTGAPA